MAVYAPISGSYIHYTERWLHPSLGFAMGWQICLQYMISLPSEVIAASILVSFWDTGKSAPSLSLTRRLFNCSKRWLHHTLCCLLHHYREL